MQKNTTLGLLKSFSSKELKEFDKFIISPFFNNQNSLIKYYKALIKYYPDFEEKKLEKEKLFKTLYPGKKFKDEIMRKLSSDLKKLLDEFLAYSQFRSNKVLFEKALLTEFRNRKQEKLFEQRIGQFEKDLDKPGRYDREYFDAKKDMHALMLGYIFHMNKLNYTNYDFSKRGEYIIYSFLMDILNLKFDSIFIARELSGGSKQSLMDEFFSNFNMDAIISYMKSTRSPYYKTFGLIHAGLQAFMNNDDDKYYYEYKQLIEQYWDTFDKGTKYILHINLSTYCTFKVEKGKTDFRTELFALYNRMLDENFYIYRDDGYFDINLWRQIMLTAVLQKQFSWLENFIGRYKDTLSPAVKEDMVNFSYARLYFARTEFDTALGYISRINSDYTIFKTDVRNMLLQIYYEMDYIEQLLSLMDSYKHFLTDNSQIPEIRKKNYTGFIKNMNLLLKLKKNPEPYKIKTFIETILAEQAAFGDWLIKKAKEISS